MKKKSIIILLSVVALVITAAVVSTIFFSYSCYDCGKKVLFQNFMREYGTGEDESFVYVCSNCYDDYYTGDNQDDDDYDEDDSFNINDYSQTFNDDCYNKYIRVVEEIENSQNADTYNARKLYERLLANESLTFNEKKELTRFIQYFVDNQYIDCDYVCNKLINFVVNENDPALLDDGIGAAYYEDNSITFATEEERQHSLAHELHHAIENKNLDYEEYGWFSEGFTCLVIAEYFNGDDTINSQAFFIRALAEFVGSDILFQVSANGDMDILISALVECGINQKDINKLFNMFKQLKEIESYNSMSIVDERIEVAQFIVDLYCTTYNCEEITDSLYSSIVVFLYQSDENFEYYYLNSTLKNCYDTSYVSLDELEDTYNSARYELE